MTNEEVIRYLDGLRKEITDTGSYEYEYLTMAIDALKTFENGTETKSYSKDTIYRQDAIDAIEDVDWYHQNKFTKEMVSGSSSEYESWYKADDIYNAIDCVPSAQPKQNGWVHIDDIYRLISGHSDYHGDNILAALTCLAEGKEVLEPITVLDTQPEREKGKWIDGNNIQVGWDKVDKSCPADSCKCSNCGEWLVASDEYWVKGNFCPNCGADMRGKKRVND